MDDMIVPIINHGTMAPKVLMNAFTHSYNCKRCFGKSRFKRKVLKNDLSVQSPLFYRFRLKNA